MAPRVYLKKETLMKIGIIGATGNAGRAILAQARSHGHETTAIVRNPSKVADMRGLLLARGVDTTIGCVIALGVFLVLTPRTRLTRILTP